MVRFVTPSVANKFSSRRGPSAVDAAHPCRPIIRTVCRTRRSVLRFYSSQGHRHETTSYPVVTLPTSTLSSRLYTSSPPLRAKGTPTGKCNPHGLVTATSSTPINHGRPRGLLTIPVRVCQTYSMEQTTAAHQERGLVAAWVNWCAGTVLPRLLLLKRELLHLQSFQRVKLVPAVGNAPTRIVRLRAGCPYFDSLTCINGAFGCGCNNSLSVKSRRLISLSFKRL